MKMDLKDRKEWRRDQIQQLQAKGYKNHREIAGILQLPKTTVTREIQSINAEAKTNIKKFVDERLPEEYEKILVGLTSILKKAWETSEDTEIDTKERLQALSLVKECYSMKLELLTNATVLEDATQFVAKHKKINTAKDQENEEEIKSKGKEKEGINESEQQKDNNATLNTVNKVF